MQIDQIKEILKNTLKPERYTHTLNTADMAKKLAAYLHEDEDKAYLAGLVHDCAKNLSDEELLAHAHKYHIDIDAVTQQAPYLLHGAVGAFIAKERFGIDDEEILSAVTWHTTGKENMSMLDKIIFLADLTEISRTYEDVKAIREIQFEDFNRALIMAFDGVIAFVLRKGCLLHTDTINARNYLLMQQSQNCKIKVSSEEEPF